MARFNYFKKGVRLAVPERSRRALQAVRLAVPERSRRVLQAKVPNLVPVLVMALGTFTLGIIQSIYISKIPTKLQNIQANELPTVGLRSLQATDHKNRYVSDQLSQSDQSLLVSDENIIRQFDAKKLEISGLVSQRVDYSRKAIGNIAETRFKFSIPKQFQGKTIKKVSLNSKDKVIALTFDDGPWPKTTEQILAILEKNEIKATFFFIGQHLKNFPEIGKKVAKAGHVLGNHTWNHPTNPVLSEERVASEIGRTAELIDQLTGMRTALFRPPGGVETNGLAAYAHQKKQLVVLWSSDSLDWRDSQNTLIDNVLRSASQGGIVLLHDGGGNRSATVAALPVIIAELKKQGYKFVTVPELLEMNLKKQK